jgi:hypothetical protein
MFRRGLHIVDELRVLPDGTKDQSNDVALPEPVCLKRTDVILHTWLIENDEDAEAKHVYKVFFSAQYADAAVRADSEYDAAGRSPAAKAGDADRNWNGDINLHGGAVHIAELYQADGADGGLFEEDIHDRLARHMGHARVADGTENQNRSVVGVAAAEKRAAVDRLFGGDYLHNAPAQHLNMLAKDLRQSAENAVFGMTARTQLPCAQRNVVSSSEP